MDRALVIDWPPCTLSLLTWNRRRNKETTCRTGKNNVISPLGKKWVNRFLKRHPTISARVSKNIELARKQVTKEEVLEWFAVFQKVCEQNGIDSENIYNMDETGLYYKDYRWMTLQGSILVFEVGMHGLYAILRRKRSMKLSQDVRNGWLLWNVFVLMEPQSRHWWFSKVKPQCKLDGFLTTWIKIGLGHAIQKGGHVIKLEKNGLNAASTLKPVRKQMVESGC